MPKILNIATGPVDSKEFTKKLGYASAVLYFYTSQGLVLNPDGSVNPKEVYDWAVANNKNQLAKKTLAAYQVTPEDGALPKAAITPEPVKYLRCIIEMDAALTAGKDYVLLFETPATYLITDDNGIKSSFPKKWFAFVDPYVSDVIKIPNDTLPKNRTTGVPHDDSLFVSEFFPEESTAAPVQSKKDYLSKMSVLFDTFIKKAEALRDEYMASIEKGVDD